MRSLLLCSLERIAMVVASVLVVVAGASNVWSQTQYSPVKLGVDNLLELRLEPLRGKRIALVCNAASRTRFERETLAEIASNGNVAIASLLLVEGTAIPHAQALQHVPTYLLSAGNRRPTRAMLHECDAVVIDVQDVGLRPALTLGTLYHILDACAEYGIEVYILDRPNPLGGVVVDGAIPSPALERTSFTVVPVPYIHGMTIGELALMINSEGWLSPDPVSKRPRQCKLHIVKMRRWRRTATWDQTHWQWIAPSPNIPSPDALRGMAIVGLVGELGAVSVGIGTDRPFQFIGAPDFSEEIIARLCDFFARHGIVATPTSFLPSHGAHAGTLCRGVTFNIPAALPLPSYTVACELLDTLAALYRPVRDSLDQLHHRQRLLRITGDIRFAVSDSWQSGSIAHHAMFEDFLSRRQRYLLYP